MKSLDSDNATLYIIKNIKEYRNDVICSVQVFFYLLTKKTVKQHCIFFPGFATTFKIENANIILSNVNQFGLTGSSFKLDGFHFHTGRYNSMMGSEHSFDGKFTPLEVWFSHSSFLNV